MRLSMPTAVVIATRNRRELLLRSLERTCSLPEAPRVVVVDNASSDGTAEAVAGAFPHVEVIALAHNAGAAARNAGVRHVEEDVVAFADDDSWWAPGSLARAEDLFAEDGRLGLVAARVLVGPEEREDAVCSELAGAARVEGFLACAAVVRRAAFLAVGGFNPRLLVRAEERLLAIDLARDGWRLAYDPSLVAHHHPPPRTDGAERSRLQARNDLWVAWLRLPLCRALAETASSLRRPGAVLAAARGLPWVLRERDPGDPLASGQENRPFRESRGAASPRA